MNNNPTDIYGNLTWLNKQVQKLYCLIESLGGGGGSITINPTDGVVPVRTSATTFGDSAIESNEFFTRIQHEFADNNSIMRLFISAEEQFKIETFSYDNPQSSQIILNAQYIEFGVGGDGVNSFISMNQNSVSISAFESGHYTSNINADPSSTYLNAQYINADNEDDKYWSRQTISSIQIVTNVYSSNEGNFETSYTETIVPGYFDILLIHQDLDTQLRTTYNASSASPLIDTYLSNDGGNTILRTTYNGNINSPSISTSINIGDGELLSGYLLEKSKISFAASSSVADSGCTFKIYVSGPKTRYNFSNIYTYASNAVALANGLVAGDIYRHSGGALNIVF
jgi:hypothetical protein